MDVQIDTLTRTAWERNCDRAHAALQQRWAYGETVKRLGGNVHRFVICDRETPIALAQVLIRRCLLRVGLLMRGPAWLGEVSDERRRAAFLALREEMRTRNVPVLLTSSNCERALPFGAKVFSAATIAALPLSDGMRGELDGKWRNRLVKTEALALPIKTLTTRDDDHDWLFENENRQRRDRGYRSLPSCFSEVWLQEPSAQTLTLVAAKPAECAAMMFLRHGNTATYHLGWTGESGRAVGAHNALMWKAMEMLRDKGVKMLDLGILDTVQSPGLARFKLGTGAVAKRLGPTVLSL